MSEVFSKTDGMLAEAAKQFTSVSVNRGKTAFPKVPGEDTKFRAMKKQYIETTLEFRANLVARLLGLP